MDGLNIFCFFLFPNSSRISEINSIINFLVFLEKRKCICLSLFSLLHSHGLGFPPTLSPELNRVAWMKDRLSDDCEDKINEQLHCCGEFKGSIDFLANGHISILSHHLLSTPTVAFIWPLSCVPVFSFFHLIRIAAAASSEPFISHVFPSLL